MPNVLCILNRTGIISACTAFISPAEFCPAALHRRYPDRSRTLSWTIKDAFVRLLAQYPATLLSFTLQHNHRTSCFSKYLLMPHVSLIITLSSPNRLIAAMAHRSCQCCNTCQLENSASQPARASGVSPVADPVYTSRASTLIWRTDSLIPSIVTSYPVAANKDHT